MQKYDYYNRGVASTPLSPNPPELLYAMTLQGALGRYLTANVRSDSEAHYDADISTGICHDLFVCPSEVNLSIGTTITDGVSAGLIGYSSPNSYDFNEMLLGFTSDSDTLPGARQHGNLNRIPRQAENMYMADGKGRSSPDGTHTEYADQLKDLYSFAANATMADVLDTMLTAGTNEIDMTRHRGKINISFFDGHVQTFTINDTDLQHVGLTLGCEHS
jgi:prepilin-type processing-associated H-X9-DG protein